MSLKRVVALIPAFNEEKYIGATVASLAALPEVNEIVVVDDASTDRTAQLAAAAGARVISMPRNSGKGAALNRGSADINAGVIMLLDGDLGETAREARWLLEPVLAGQADMTVARFPPPRRKGGFGLVKGLARKGIKFYTGLEMQSPLSGQRVMTRQVMEKLLPFASGYGVEVGLTIKAVRAGFKVLEVPVQMTHAETGRDLKGFWHRGRQFCHVALVLARAAVK
ncbi:glycosyltransferase family 2 protein [Desulfallas thermosapovorans]|uniref:Glucosyl-3-phosphoglycerate synthase n=1 Tax=Desulfallas thermosapovorans DSM 6562 TaxID=1121431 RepID=A0A5S4ZSH6_9FIRM|nr:glycosyltransferase family 2 protein [Desulfallas thermosapovorans]TYO95608.1 glycosyl transferase family 2 [Desulfallas thermosapovorans DSM 6562]